MTIFTGSRGSGRSASTPDPVKLEVHKATAATPSCARYGSSHGSWRLLRLSLAPRLQVKHPIFHTLQTNTATAQLGIRISAGRRCTAAQECLELGAISLACFNHSLVVHRAAGVVALTGTSTRCRSMPGVCWHGCRGWRCLGQSVKPDPHGDAAAARSRSSRQSTLRRRRGHQEGHCCVWHHGPIWKVLGRHCSWHCKRCLHLRHWRLSVGPGIRFGRRLHRQHLLLRR